MFRRGLVLAAVVVYLLVLGCVVWPPGSERSTLAQEDRSAAPAPGTIALASLPYRGVTLHIQRVDWIDRYLRMIDRAAALGADTVTLAVELRQENATSTRIYLDMRTTPTVDQLTELLQHAKKKGLRVIVLPTVCLDDPGKDWRGTIQPENWDKWFDSYREAMNQFAWVSQGNGVDVLVVGSELASAEDQVEQWTRTIQETRSVFKGQLTYLASPERAASVRFWAQLDLIGIDSRWSPRQDRNVSVEQVAAGWRALQEGQRNRHEGLLALGHQQHRPLLLLETTGYRPWDTADESSEQTATDHTAVDPPVDPALRLTLITALFESWYGNPLLGGLTVVGRSPDAAEAGEPAQAAQPEPVDTVLRQWLAKPKWSVEVR